MITVSVCIPVYNFPVRDLVLSLYQQLVNSGIAFEILVLEDGSTQYISDNASALAKSHVRHIISHANLGRAAARNLLAKEATFEWLYFLDADSKITAPGLMERWLQIINQPALYSGGRIYQVHPPQDKQYILHWLWGSKRELLDASIRNSNKANVFLSNNFWVPRTLFLTTPFDEDFKGYGYEDTLFAHRWVERGYLLMHVENPVLHDGLEPVSIFLGKIEHSLSNLLKLLAIYEEAGKPIPVSSKLIQAYQKLKDTWVKKWAINLGKRAERKLYSANPRLMWFDLYRLGKLLELSEKK